MKAINLKSVFSSGFVSGIIINISAITMVPAVGDEMDNLLANKGLPPLSNSDMVFFSFVSFVFGIFLMFLYAVLRPHLGSRLKTAIIVSLIVWFVTYFLSNVSLIIYGFMPVKLVVIGTVWGLGELLLASVVGTGLYKEVKTE
jgi:small-conductance mechanosensitive channel